jgi:hypothetical protein
MVYLIKNCLSNFKILVKLFGHANRHYRVEKPCKGLECAYAAHGIYPIRFSFSKQLNFLKTVVPLNQNAFQNLERRFG